MNLLYFKQKSHGWGFREEDGGDGGDMGGDGGYGPPGEGEGWGFNPDPMGNPNEGPQQPTMGSPNEGPQPEAPKGLWEGLKSLFSSGIGREENANWNDPTTRPLLTRLGIIPGMDKESFFNNETSAERDDRMGLVNNTIGTLGQAFMNAAMPPPIRLGLAAYGAYDNYNKTGDLSRSLGMGLAGLPGYFGAAGQALQGNYGNAVAMGLMKSGIDPTTAAALGIGTDAYNDRDVTSPVFSLGGYMAGSRLGGPMGGVFGQNLANMFTRRRR